MSPIERSAGGGGASAPSIGSTSLVFRYTVAGSDKASIDTGVDTPDAGSNDWTNGNLLEIFLYARTDEAVVPSFLGLTFNNDTGAVYDLVRMQVSNGVVSGGGTGNQTHIFFPVSGASAAANEFGYMRAVVPNYAGTVGFKALELASGEVDSGSPTNLSYNMGAIYRSTAALTRLSIFTDTAAKKLKVGTQLLIYKRLAS